jgi:hypothetical protein
LAHDGKATVSETVSKVASAVKLRQNSTESTETRLQRVHTSQLNI